MYVDDIEPGTKSRHCHATFWLIGLSKALNGR